MYDEDAPGYWAIGSLWDDETDPDDFDQFEDDDPEDGGSEAAGF